MKSDHPLTILRWYICFPVFLKSHTDGSVLPFFVCKVEVTINCFELINPTKLGFPLECYLWRHTHYMEILFLTHVVWFVVLRAIKTIPSWSKFMYTLSHLSSPYCPLKSWWSNIVLKYHTQYTNWYQNEQGTSSDPAWPLSSIHGLFSATSFIASPLRPTTLFGARLVTVPDYCT